MSKRIPAAFLLVLLCSGCNGPVLEEKKLLEINPSAFDGGFISYFLPRGELTAKASFTVKNKQLSLSIEPLKSVPDFSQHYHLVYNHKGLSTDEIDVQTENGLLKSVSSKSTDQSLQLVQGLTGILEQVKATKAAISAVAENSFIEGPKKTTIDKCIEDLAVTKVVDITNRKLVTEKNENFSTTCQIVLEITTSSSDQRSTTEAIKSLKPEDYLDARFYPHEDEITGKPSCEGMVCFRLPGAYIAHVRACLADIEGNPLKASQVKDHKINNDASICAESDVEFLAPMKYPRGFIRFDRRAFVDNSVTATFTNGMLTGMKARDPSELVGFLSVPVAVLKQFTVLVTF